MQISLSLFKVVHVLGFFSLPFLFSQFATMRSTRGEDKTPVCETHSGPVYVPSKRTTPKIVQDVIKTNHSSVRTTWLAVNNVIAPLFWETVFPGLIIITFLNKWLCVCEAIRYVGCWLAFWEVYDRAYVEREKSKNSLVLKITKIHLFTEKYLADRK